MKSQYVGTWYITGMEAWDADYINAAGHGHLRIDQDGCGFMQFGAVEAALDCRIEDIDSTQRLGSLISQLNKELDSYDDGG